jgi:hypothetical protein
MLIRFCYHSDRTLDSKNKFLNFQLIPKLKLVDIQSISGVHQLFEAYEFSF